MGVFARIKDIVKSNVNSMIDKAEDPEKIVNQTLRDAEKELAEVKKHTAAVMANKDSAYRQLQSCQNRISQYEQAAEAAVAAGNDQDALVLLQSKDKLAEQLAGYQENYQVALQDAEKMRAMYQKVSQQVSELQGRAAMIKGKAATAKAREHASKMTAGAGSAASQEAFDRMEAKANEQLDRAAAMEALNQIGNADEDLLNKYSSGSTTSAAQQLAAMKARMGR